MASDIINLNVGGVTYTTTKQTLRRYPDSMLGAMFNGTMPTTVEKNGHYFIDRDGHMFRYVLNYLRSSHLALPESFSEYESLLTEADFYQIIPLISEVKRRYRVITEAKVTGDSYYLEIIELRVGSRHRMQTNNSPTKTILSGRKNILLLLPMHIISEDVRAKLQKLDGIDFMEFELYGSNIRLQLGEHLKNTGWLLEDSHMSSSSVYVAESVIRRMIIEQSYTDRWYLPPHVAARISTLLDTENCDQSMVTSVKIFDQ